MSSGQVPIHIDQGGASMHIDASGHLDISSGRVTFPGSLASGSIDLTRHLFGAREMASAEEITSGTTAPTYFFGGLLLTDTTPSLDVLSTADPILRMQWVSANVDTIMVLPFSLPGDLSSAGGLTIQLYGETVGTATAADAEQGFDIKVRSGLGDTEMGATHPNLTSTPGWQGITVASGDLTTNQINVHLTPSAHAGRALNLYAMRALYTKKTS